MQGSLKFPFMWQKKKKKKQAEITDSLTICKGNTLIIPSFGGPCASCCHACALIGQFVHIELDLKCTLVRTLLVGQHSLLDSNGKGHLV